MLCAPSWTETIHSGTWVWIRWIGMDWGRVCSVYALQKSKIQIECFVNAVGLPYRSSLRPYWVHARHNELEGLGRLILSSANQEPVSSDWRRSQVKVSRHLISFELRSRAWRQVSWCVMGSSYVQYVCFRLPYRDLWDPYWAQGSLDRPNIQQLGVSWIFDGNADPAGILCFKASCQNRTGIGLEPKHMAFYLFCIHTPFPRLISSYRCQTRPTFEISNIMTYYIQRALATVAAQEKSRHILCDSGRDANGIR